MDVLTQLDQLAELQAQQDVIRLQYQQMRDSILTPEIREQLAEIDAEESTTSEAVNQGIEQLTTAIKGNVLAIGETVKGDKLQAVFMKGRVSWNTKALDGYLAAHPELAQFRKEGDPSVSIRVVK